MATAAPTKPQDDKLPVTQPTPEELKKQEGEKPIEGKAIDDFTKRFIPRPAGEKPLVPAKKKEKAAPAPPVKSKPAPAAPNPPPETVLTGDQIAEAAARGVASVMQPKAPEEKKPDAAAPKLPDREQRKISALEQMEKTSPEEYKGMAERYRNSLEALVEYAAKWEKDHPGEIFDEAADEHKEFMEKNSEGLDWDDDDYVDALAEVKLQKARNEDQQRQEAQKTQTEKIQKALPEIASAKLKAGRSFLATIGEGYQDIISKEGVVSKEAFEKLKAEDPVKTEIVVSSADFVERLVETNCSLFGQLVPFDGKNPLHAHINNVILSNEQRLLKMPPEQQRDAKGRSFLPADKYWKLPPDKRGSVWTFTQQDVSVLLVNAVLKQVKSQIAIEDKKFEDRAKARGLNLNGKHSPAGDQPATPPAKKEAPGKEDEDDKPNTPDLPAPPRTPPGNAPMKDAASTFTSRFLGKT
jgi:hypothetical protein